MASPRTATLIGIIALSTLGWLVIALAVAVPVAEGRAGALGPGMAVLEWLIGRSFEPPRWLQILCSAPLDGTSTVGNTASGVALIFAMWLAMALAMMLPTAAPMLITYSELAETAARQRQTVVSPWVLAVGYLAVWSVFAAAAALLTMALTASGWLGAAMTPLGVLPAAATFAAAGLYQFSQLKTACLRACQSPFRFFFAHWTDKRRGVFRLGLRQGLFCLGCCWAMMLVMFAVGLMNVVWMAALGCVMALEKVVPGDAVRRTIGAVLLSMAAGLISYEASRLLS